MKCTWDMWSTAPLCRKALGTQQPAPHAGPARKHPLHSKGADGEGRYTPAMWQTSGSQGCSGSQHSRWNLRIPAGRTTRSPCLSHTPSAPTNNPPSPGISRSQTQNIGARSRNRYRCLAYTLDGPTDTLGPENIHSHFQPIQFEVKNALIHTLFI